MNKNLSGESNPEDKSQLGSWATRILVGGVATFAVVSVAIKPSILLEIGDQVTTFFKDMADLGQLGTEKPASE